VFSMAHEEGFSNICECGHSTSTFVCLGAAHWKEHLAVEQNSHCYCSQVRNQRLWRSLTEKRLGSAQLWLGLETLRALNVSGTCHRRYARLLAD
jgi:hypothetical protein